MAQVSFTFTGKIALLTGASLGIGAETARHFAASGCCLSLVGRNEERLKKVGEECEEKGIDKDHVLLIIADLRKESEVYRIVKSTMSHFGKLDILVNCAGNYKVGDILHSTIDQYDDIMQVNLRSVVHLTKLCVPHLILSKGNIVNVSGTSGTRPMANFYICSMCKAAINQFTSVAALELASKHVRVNAVNPGTILTPIHETAGLSLSNVIKTAESYPLGSAGNPSEVAKAILFMASDGASFTTGETLDVSGGRMCSCPH
ncbi:3-oxoacyl-[acyl-carrier-protein] reductase FabG-like [Amphiura filiformis]|uniref:3-oxoacyl-[acyl-carrier-protein] reductase FabG-like n=1 Tax=Amphiura filiformis TaxID=82378 RepID=UPI003B20C7EE